MKITNSNLKIAITLLSMFSMVNALGGEASGLENVISATKMNNGLYHVVCEDGAEEIDVSISDLKAGLVCQPSDSLPNEITPSYLDISGSGCKSDSSSTVIYDSKRNELNVEAPNFHVGSTNLGKTTDRKFCNLSTIFSFEGDWQYALLVKETEQIGYVSGDAKGEITISSKVHGAESGVIASAKASEDSSHYTLKGSKDQLVWTPCQSALPMNTKLTLKLTGSSTVNSYLSLTEQAPLVLKVLWRKCN